METGEARTGIGGIAPPNRNMGSLFSSCWNGRTEREDEDLEKGSTVKSATKNGLRQTDSGQAETKRGSAESAAKGSSGAVEESVYLQAEKNVDPSSLNDSSMSFDSSTTTQPLLNSSSVFSKQLPEIKNAGKELGESSNPDTSSQGKDPSGASFSPERSAVISYPFNNQFLFSVNTVYRPVVLLCSLFSMMTAVLYLSSVRTKTRRS